MAYGNRSPLKRYLSSPITSVLAIIILAFLVRAAIRVHTAAEAGSNKLARTQNELADLSARKDDLSKKVTFLSTDEGVESELRTKYLGVHPGENVAVVIGPTGDGQSASAAEATSTPALGWWGRLWRKVGF